MQQVPSRQMEMLELVWSKHLSCGEAADVMGISRMSAWRLLQRAQRRVFTLLEQGGYTTITRVNPNPE